MRTATSSGERRLLLVVGAVVFVDTMFYAAIAPLLPDLSHQLHLSKLSAGVLTASYPAGTLIGSLPGGILAARAGPKRTVFVGLSLLSVSTAAFGFLHNALLLDLARFVEGVGGACSWSGGLAWIVADAAPENRGGLIGGALGAGIAGALLGPVIGTIADAIGRAPTFSAVVVVALVLLFEAGRLPSTHVTSGQGTREFLAALRSPAVMVGMWLVTLPALASGSITVLAPLRLHRFGAGAAAVGATFLVGAGLEALISPAIGRLSDRRGRLVPLSFGLAGTTVVLVCVPLPHSAVAVALLVVVLDCVLGAFWAPAMAMLSDAAEARGLDQGLAAALMNLAWAGGQVVGSAAGGAIAKAGGDGVPLTAVAALCALTLLALSRRLRSGTRNAPPIAG